MISRKNSDLAKIPAPISLSKNNTKTYKNSNPNHLQDTYKIDIFLNSPTNSFLNKDKNHKSLIPKLSNMK